MPAARKRLKSMYSTTASSVGRRLNMAAEERARDRYQIAPQRVRPQSAKISRMSSQARVLGVTNRVSHSREFAGAGFLPQPDIWLQFAHHAREIGQCEGLRTVADGLLRTRMDFHDQAVGADRHPGAGERGNQAAFARGVARVENHRQVRKLVQHRHGGDIAGIAGGGLEGPYAALAQNHVRVAVGHNVLGGHEQFLDGGTHAAFEQHRTAAAAQRIQQRKIAGRPQPPSDFSSAKFCILRAPTCITSVYSATMPTSLSLITSVTMASPVACLALRSSLRPSSSMPWKS